MTGNNNYIKMWSVLNLFIINYFIQAYVIKWAQPTHWIIQLLHRINNNNNNL